MMNTRVTRLAPCVCLLGISILTAKAQTSPAAPTPPGQNFMQRLRQPPPSFDFNDNAGFTSLFDGTLNGWDFDKRLWDIQDNAIHISATCEKPTGTVYAVSKAGEFGNFILKYEMKGTGNINSGMQFRSYVAADATAPGVHYPPREGPSFPRRRTGAAARPPACANPGTPPSRESEAKWDMAGPQADFDRNNNFSAMNYEQGGRGIMALPGYSLLATEDGVKALAQLATKETLDSWFHKDDWNQFMVIAMGHTTSIFMNGHLVTELVDVNPRYFRSSGKIAIESESTGDVWVRNIYIKKLE